MKYYKIILYTNYFSFLRKSSASARLLFCSFMALFFLESATNIYALDMVSKCRFFPLYVDPNFHYELNGKPLIPDTVPLPHPGSNNVKTAVCEGIRYFFKQQKFKTGATGSFSQLFDSIFASRILNIPFPPEKPQRFPIITLGLNEYDNQLYGISQELTGFKSDNILYGERNSGAWWPFDPDHIESVRNDLAYVYVAFYLIGGGDPSPDNIVFSKDKNIFGSVDLDIAFKWHITSKTPEVQRDLKTQSDLALREFNCSAPAVNFLYDTDSNMHNRHDREPLGTYTAAHTYEICKDRKLIDSIALIKAMEFVTAIPLEEYTSSIQQTATELKSGYERVAGKPLNVELNEDHKIAFITERYNFMKYLVNEFAKYSEKNNFSIEDDKTYYSLLEKWCLDYSNKKSDNDQNQQTPSSEYPKHEDL